MSTIITRRHKIYTARQSQIENNKFAVHGGRPYIDRRLWRAPNETDVSWLGDPSRGIVGRKQRAALVPDAARVANKINQYIFKKSAERTGTDEAFLANCTGMGESIHEFMQRVNSAVTFGGWCWLQVDRAALQEGESETLANKAPIKWMLWDALDVTDWCFDGNGLKWIIVRSQIYLNDDPRQDAKEGYLFTLYELKDGIVHITEEADGNLQLPNLRVGVPIPGLKRIPFIPVGLPSDAAWWFDDVENLQAQILNLDSQHNETLTESVYPQIVLPSSLSNSLEARLLECGEAGEKVVTLIREATLGRKIPIMEGSEDKGISRYISPTGDFKILTDECTRKRSLLFDVAGLALFNRETRQVQTAESKQFDQMDTNSTLENRALLLQETEKKLVELSKVFDPSFKEYEPKYPSDFDVVDVAALSAALTSAANAPDKTPLVRKIIAKANLRILREICSGIATDEEFSAAIEEIDEHDFETQPTLPNPFDGMNDDEGDE